MTAPGILGRADELQALTQLVEQAPDQGGALVLLGEAGIGKSTLIRAAAQHARAAGLQVLETTVSRPRRGCRSPACINCCAPCCPPPVLSRPPSGVR